MKKIFAFITCLVLVLGVSGCGKVTIEHLQPSDIQKKIDAKETFVLEFASSSCAHCIAFAPVYEEYANENRDVTFYRVMMEEVNDATEKQILRDYALKYTIGGTPTTLFFKDGVYKGQIVGAVSKEELVAKTEQYLK